MPFLSNCSAKRFEPCLVRINTKTCSQLPWRISISNKARFFSRSTGCTTWEIVSAVVLRGATSILSGFFRMLEARVLISSEKVAENKRFWRFAGNNGKIRRISRIKPISSMRSASSKISVSTQLKSTVR